MSAAAGSTSRTVNPALVLAVLATASFTAALDVWITNVPIDRRLALAEDA
jgi:hypothetical protein